MKKLCLILLAFLLLFLCACAQEAPEETTVPTVAETTAAPTETTAQTVPETTEAALIQPEPVFDDYMYVHTDARDLAWEQDIIYMAKLYLGEQVVKGYPKLINQEVQVITADNWISMDVFYDEALREQFIQAVYDLIPRIPELTDTAVQYEMQRILALLEDSHGGMTMPIGEYFPFAVEQLEQAGELGLYVTMLPSAYEHLLLSKLEAINDIPAEDILEALIPYIPTENTYRAAYCATSVFQNGLIMDKIALQAIGVVGAEEDTARFRFLTDSGETVEIQLEALDLLNGEYSSLPRTGAMWTNMDFLSYSRMEETNYWFEYLPEQDALYIRFYQMIEEENLRIDAFLIQIRDQIRKLDGVSKTIIDLRDNPGGYTDLIKDFIKMMKDEAIGTPYVLINSGSFSAAVISPWYLKTNLEGTILVGTPAGQPINFFANATTVPLRNHDISVSIPYRYCVTDTEDTSDALMPDILVYPKLEDYAQGIDTILEAALAD